MSESAKNSTRTPHRYVTAMKTRNLTGFPSAFAAEFAGKYAGYTCQQVTHDADCFCRHTQMRG